jgi:predicted ATP-grasp superfamily ATP-dependent carboligase
VPVDVVSFNAAEPALISRAIRNFYRIPRPDLDPAGFVDQLSELLRRDKHDMLIPADDQSLMAITTHYDELNNLTHLACPPPLITSLVLDKLSTLEAAQKCGIQIPNTKLISNSKQLPGFFSSLPFPWVIKPARKDLRVEEHKTLTFATADEVIKRFPLAQEFTPPMLLQQFCTGEGVGVEVLMNAGEGLAVFQHRRLQELPYTGGYSVTAVAERPNHELVENALALLRALQWEGPAMVEFKVNTRSGGAILMEVNGRYWGTIALPIFAGIDFPLFQWQLIHGEVPAVPDHYAVGAKWRWTAGHLGRFNGLLLAARRSDSARRELLLSVLQLPATFAPWIHDALFSLSDPMPAIREVLWAVRYHLSDNWRALSRRVSRHRES